MTETDPPQPDHERPGPGDAPFAGDPTESDAGRGDARPRGGLSPRWRLVKDVVIFQGKLFLDAIRDVLLSPVSIVAALVGLFRGGDNPGEHFYEVMKWGRRSDHFIDLFSAGRDETELDTSASLDDIVNAVEDVIVDEEKRGGMTAEARAHVERALLQIEQATVPERQRLGYRVKRAAVRLRQEARKVRDQIAGPGSGS